MMRIQSSAGVVLRRLLLATLIFPAPATAGAQAMRYMPTFDAQLAAMNKLTQMVGVWEGEGWVEQSGPRQTFKGSERVTSKLDGLALLVEGRFTTRLPGSDADVPAHVTLAVIAYDATQKRYRFSTWLATGAAGQYELVLLPEGWEWSLTFPGGSVKYTATFPTRDQWIEVGVVTMDGQPPRNFFEMRLKRVE